MKKTTPHDEPTRTYVFLDVYAPKMMRAKTTDVTSAANAIRKRVESRIVDGRILPFRKYRIIIIAITKNKLFIKLSTLLLRRKLI